MRKTFQVCACVFALLLATRARANIDASLQLQLGNPSNATADTNNHDHYLIQRAVEAIDYNDNLGEPNWASWDLTASDIGAVGRSPNFFVDTNLPANFHRVGTTEYSGSGYDRGHLCPSADRTDTTNDNQAVFFMSNIMPQAPDNNSGVWANFENYCRSLVRSTNNYELLIITGPSGFDASHINTNGYVSIPQCTWKIVVVVPPGPGTALSRITATNRVIAIKVPNTNRVSTVWQNFVASVSQVQLDTGYTFFTALPSDVATALRSKVDGQFSGIIAGWDASGLPGGVNNYGPSPWSATTSAPNVSVIGITRGLGVDQSYTAAAAGWGGDGFISTTAVGAIASEQYATFSVAAETGYELSFTAISKFDYRRSPTGPVNGLVQYQIGSSGFADLANLVYSSSNEIGARLDPIDLSGIDPLQHVGANIPVTFRIVNWGGGSRGTWVVPLENVISHWSPFRIG